MSLYLASLNSGSNGNCYYIGNEQDAILIDAGISSRKTVRRMAELGLSVEKVRAIVISHEHGDHVRGVEVLSRSFRIPVIMSATLVLNDLLPVEHDLMRTFSDGERIDIRSLQVIPFAKQHDSADPYSFTVGYHGITVGVFTDIGEVCPNVIRHFSLCHAAFLEANYDEKMLEEGPYPAYLKARIRSAVGHLSNHQALELFTRHRSPHLSHLVLSHLSQHNNHPSIVAELFSQHANGTRIDIASRHGVTGVFTV